MRIIGTTLVVLLATATSSGAFAGSSPFCFGGSPTPKHICDAIKANQKPKPVVINQGFATPKYVGGGSMRLNSGRVIGR